MRAVVRPAALLIGLFAALVGVPALELGAQAATGEVLAVVGRQVASVSLAGLRPRAVSAFPFPANAVDVHALASSTIALVAVTSPAVDGSRGGDLYSLDVTTGAAQVLLTRQYAGESLAAPAWLPDSSGFVFQRDDLYGELVAPPGHEVAHYPGRIEEASADGTGRTILSLDGHHPSPSPDGSSVVFARSSNLGSSIHVVSRRSGWEWTLIPLGQFYDLASPRYAPSGDVIAFAAPQASLAGSRERELASSIRNPLSALLGVSRAYAHGFAWSVWLVNVDGTAPRLLAELTADEPSLTWSPDGTRLFVYGISGAWVVTVANGDVIPFPRLIGTGTVAWIAD